MARQSLLFILFVKDGHSASSRLPCVFQLVVHSMA
jgi:hypothetical protein